MCLFAVPTPASTVDPTFPTECEAVSFHLNDPSSKEILGQTVDHFNDGQFRPVGSYPFADLLTAYDNVTLKSDDPTSYDIVTNNCAQIVLAMMCALGIEVTDEILSWTADALLSTQDDGDGDILFRLMANSTHLADIGVTDGRELVASDVYAMVTAYAGNFHCSSLKSAGGDEKESSASSSAIWWMMTVGIGGAAAMMAALPVN